MLSNKCKYAIRAVLYLSTKSSHEHKFSIKEIAQALKIPFPFLGKILQDLARKKIISSAKGPKGGFYLSDDDRKLPLIHIIEEMDGLSFFTSCALGLENCSDQHPCPIHKEYKISRSLIEDLFTKKTINDVSDEIAGTDLYLVV